MGYDSQTWGADFFCDHDVGACFLVPIETFNTLFKSTQNKQQYATIITCTDVRKKLTVSRNLSLKSWIFGGPDPQ